MAKMYPEHFPKDNPSSGEKKVFEHFKSQAPDNWIVLHSLRLPEHPRVVYGEADFVIIVPRIGVIVLEVKSGGVGFDGTYWIYKDRYGKETKKTRGPFSQAKEGMFKVIDMISERLGSCFDRKHILYGYGVIFTDEENFPKEAIVEDEPWRLYEKSDGDDYSEFMVKLAENFTNELRRLRKTVPGNLSESDAEKIRCCLRPEVDCILPLKSFLEESEDDIIRLTNEQYACLDDIRENKRVVIQGGAGTGKTLIAVQAAKEASKEGLKTALFCYNRNLATYLKNNLPGLNVEVCTLHTFMCKMAGVYVTEADKDFFEKELPEKACAAIEKSLFDKIFVDEFQDICLPQYLKFFDKILNEGLKNGEFAFFGDFSRQAIYNRNITLANLNPFVPYYTKKSLTINCRNTKFIGKEVVCISGYNDGKYMLKVTGEPVDYIEWSNREEEKQKLRDLLKDLKSKGIAAESIMILSWLKREKSVVGELDPYGYYIEDYGNIETNIFAYFSTIYAFKGLESKIVILVDIENYDDVQLMYTALSRARSKLYVFESPLAYNQRTEKSLRGMN